MSATVNFHGVTEVKAYTYAASEWLQVSDGKGNSCTIFMPYGVASSMADAFAEWRAAHLSPETEVFSPRNGGL